MQYLIKLRTLLRYDLTYYIFLIVTSIYVITIIKTNYIPTKYKQNDNIIKGVIDTIKWNGNHLKMIVKAKEKIIVNYYYDDYETYLNDFNNLKLGDYIIADGEIKKPNKNTNFNLFNYKNYLQSNKIYWIFNARKIITYSLNKSYLYGFKNNIINYLKNYNESYPYMKTFILGDTSELEDDILKTYKDNGISHILAASGMHVTILSGILLFFFKKIFKRTLISYSIVIMFLFLYLFLSNYSISITRATLYFILRFINLSFNLKVKPINILLFILSILLIYNPYSIYNIGLQFSFIISIFLTIYNKKINKYNNYFLKLFIISFISFLVSIPIQINNNFTINIMSPIVNLIIVPLFTFIIFPFSLILLFIPNLKSLFEIVMIVVEKLINVISYLNIEITLAHIPLYITILYYFLIILFINGLFSNKKRLLFPLLLMIYIHSNIALFNKYPTITMLDVGQGDSILISLPNNKANILVDTGGKTTFEKQEWKIKKTKGIVEQVTIPYLKSIGITRIDYLILTHGDSDHVKETDYLIDNFKVKNVLFNSGKDNTKETQIIKKLLVNNINYQKISETKITIHGYTFNFINSKNTKDENKDSLIIYSNINDYNLLLMADADKENEKYIMNNYKLPNIDILKVAHHGSKNNTSSNFINKINPKISLISVGRNNLFGHPNKETLDILKNSNIYQTNNNGSIRLILRKKLSIYTCI